MRRQWMVTIAFAALLLASALIVAGWCAPAWKEGTPFAIRVPGVESDGDYHLRLLRYHGRESKDAGLQAKHAAEIVAGKHLDVLIEEVASGRYDGRYCPGPIQMLQQIGQPAKDVLQNAEAALRDEGNGQSLDDSVRAGRIQCALVLGFKDFNSLSELTVTLKELNGRIPCHSLRRELLAVHALLEREFEQEVPEMLECEDNVVAAKPAFEMWWREVQSAGGKGQN